MLLSTVEAGVKAMEIGASLILYIAPVAGSTIRSPMTPQKTTFPKYQPSSVASRGKIKSSYPGFENLIEYFALLKNPLLAFNGMAAGVIPL